MYSQNRNNKAGLNNPSGKADIEFLLTDEGFLVIQDLDLGNMSVTNDMHNVVKSIEKSGLNLYQLKVIYKDSSGIYDAVLISPDNSLFGIASLNAGTLDEAFKTYNTRILDQCLIPHTAFNPC